MYLMLMKMKIEGLSKRQLTRATSRQNVGAQGEHQQQKCRQTHAINGQSGTKKNAGELKTLCQTLMSREIACVCLLPFFVFS